MHILPVTANLVLGKVKLRLMTCLKSLQRKVDVAVKTAHLRKFLTLEHFEVGRATFKRLRHGKQAIAISLQFFPEQTLIISTNS